MKLAFHNPLFGNPNRDLTGVEKGNPGWGGTQYCFALLIYKLAVNYPDIKILVYSDCKLTLPINCKGIVVKKDDLLKQAQTDKVDFLIIKTPLDVGFYKEAERYRNISIICWSHNYFNAHIAKAISRCDQVKSVVFVGKQMYDFYYDHDVIKKSTYIYNPIPDRTDAARQSYRPHTAVYMGSIVRQKGIIPLLKIWQMVEQRYPDAELKILGAGNLYNANKKLGSFGIAEEKLEKEMSKYFLSPDGMIKKSIKFLGIMGEEKYDVFKDCAVGIVNPSADTETFGMGIVEMNSVGLPVVTKGWNGHFDTIVNGETGLLAFTNKGIANAIMHLFEDEGLNQQLGQQGKRRVAVFNPDNIAKQWYQLLFNLLVTGYKFELLPLSHPYWNNYKFLRYLQMILRHKFYLRFLPSIVDIETSLNDLRKKVKASR